MQENEFRVQSSHRKSFSHVRDYNNSSPPPTTPARAAPTTVNISPVFPTAAPLFPPVALGLGEPLDEPPEVREVPLLVLILLLLLMWEVDKLTESEGVLVPPLALDTGVDVWIVTPEEEAVKWSEHTTHELDSTYIRYTPRLGEQEQLANPRQYSWLEYKWPQRAGT
jgi:hypothetical protein